MEGVGRDRFADLRDGLFALLASMERAEDEMGIDLASLRLDVETLIKKTERSLRGRPVNKSAVVTFDHLLRLDGGFSAIASQWTEARRAAGLAAANEIVAHMNVHDAWRERWGDSFEYAWAHRRVVEERDARTESGARPRSMTESLPLVLALDLRYATDLPLARIAEFFHLSASAVQARVANFEGRVAEEIVHAMIRQQLPPGWRIASRFDDSDFQLREDGSDGRDLAIDIHVVPAWPDRESSAGRPREAASLSPSRASDRRRRVWAVIFFEGPRVYFVPDARARAAAEEAKIPYTRLDTVIQFAPSIGYPDLGDAITSVTLPTLVNEA